MSDVWGKKVKSEIPTKSDLNDRFWFLSPGTLSINAFKRLLALISTVEFDIVELEFIFFTTISNLIIHLEVFSFDSTFSLKQAIKKNTVFLKTLCLKQKHSTLFFSDDYLNKFTKVFDYLLNLEEKETMEQQICLDQIEHFRRFIKNRSNYWFNSGELQAYLWRWNFTVKINALIYFSFLIPKEKKYVDVLQNNGYVYLEKMQNRCNCMVSTNYNFNHLTYDDDFILMEVLFDAQKGKPLGFLDMLKYFVQQTNLTPYFIKSFRTILIVNSEEYIFLSNAPIKKLDILGKILLNNQPYNPFLSEFSCVKLAISENIKIAKNEERSDNIALLGFLWTKEIEGFEYWKNKIGSSLLMTYKEDLINYINSYTNWCQMLDYNDLKPSSLDKIKRCKKNKAVNEITLQLKSKKNYNVLYETEESIDNIYSMIFSDKSEEEFIPSVKSMRYLSGKQTGMEFNPRNSYLNPQAIENLARSSSSASKPNVSQKVRESIYKDPIEFKIKMIRNSFLFESLKDELEYHDSMLLESKLLNKPKTFQRKWQQIALLETDWITFLSKLQKNNKTQCINNYYEYVKSKFKMTDRIRNIPLFTVFITLQMLTENTLVYNSHFSHLNEGRSIEIPMITVVNEVTATPVFLKNLIPNIAHNSITELKNIFSDIILDLFLLLRKRIEPLITMFQVHKFKFNQCTSSLENATLKKSIEILEFQKQLDCIEENINGSKENTLKNSLLVDALDDFLFFSENIFGKPCSNWMDNKYFGIKVLYHSMIIYGYTKLAEPFLRLPGDRRIRKIENHCKCIIVLKERTHTLSKSVTYMIEIFYDFFYGNHFSCLELLSNMLTELKSNMTRFKPHRTLICTPSSGELWVVGDMDWLKFICN